MPEAPGAHATARTAAMEHRRHISLIAAGSAIFSLFFNWVATFYRDVRVSELFSDYADDGLCPTPESAIGVHCFGDFYAPMRILTGEQGSNPWLLDGSWNYSPLSNWPMLPLVILRGGTRMANVVIDLPRRSRWRHRLGSLRVDSSVSRGEVVWVCAVARPGPGRLDPVSRRVRSREHRSRRRSATHAGLELSLARTAGTLAHRRISSRCSQATVRRSGVG